jgi:predicted Zn-dependent protease
MKRTNLRPNLLAALLMLSLGAASVAAQQNVYDKFRDKTYSNDKLGISEQDEIKLGNEVHQQLLNPPRQQGQQQQEKPVRLVQGTALNRYVEDLGQRLARTSLRPNIPWNFYVVDDDSINAFATLGGHVYVHLGLISRVQNEAQLASVIGHEIGHIVGRHGLENVKRAGSIKTQGAVIGATILGAILGGEAGAQAGNAVGSMIAGGYLMKHGREAEREADYLGLYNIHKTGYNTAGMTGMFEILAQLSKGGGGGLGSILASHPPATERLANTQREIDERMRGSNQRGVSNTDNFNRARSGMPVASTTTTNTNNPNTRPRESSGRPRRPRP